MNAETKTELTETIKANLKGDRPTTREEIVAIIKSMRATVGDRYKTPESLYVYREYGKIIDAIFTAEEIVETMGEVAKSQGAL